MNKVVLDGFFTKDKVGVAGLTPTLKAYEQVPQADGSVVENLVIEQVVPSTSNLAGLYSWSISQKEESNYVFYYDAGASADVDQRVIPADVKRIHRSKIGSVAAGASNNLIRDIYNKLKKEIKELSGAFDDIKELLEASRLSNESVLLESGVMITKEAETALKSLKKAQENLKVEIKDVREDFLPKIEEMFSNLLKKRDKDNNGLVKVLKSLINKNNNKEFEKVLSEISLNKKEFNNKIKLLAKALKFMRDEDKKEKIAKAENVLAKLKKNG